MNILENIINKFKGIKLSVDYRKAKNIKDPKDPKDPIIFPKSKDEEKDKKSELNKKASTMRDNIFKAQNNTVSAKPSSFRNRNNVFEGRKEF
jgi:hypothetical protein